MVSRGYLGEREGGYYDTEIVVSKRPQNLFLYR